MPLGGGGEGSRIGKWCKKFFVVSARTSWQTSEHIHNPSPWDKLFSRANRPRIDRVTDTCSFTSRQPEIR